MPKLDTLHLEFVGRSYRCQMAVPRHLRAVIGKAKLVRSLKTDSLSTANLRKLKVLHDFRKHITDAERKLKGQGPDPLMAEALEWREAFELEAGQGDGGPDSPDYVSTALAHRYEELVKTEGEERATAMVKVAAGKETPLQALIDDWLTERAMRPRQSLDYRRAVTKLTTWLAASGHPPTVEGVTKRVASDYRMATFVRPGVNPKTANKDISALSSLWKFAERRGLVEDNPWRGQSLPKAKAAADGTQKRPYTDRELAALLSSEHASPSLRDAMTLLALSGMRVEELARMKVGDIRDATGRLPYIALQGTKTQAALRDVPIHPGVLPIILRRANGKGEDAYLLDELPTPPDDSATERGQPITKAFGRLRQRLGIDERVEGARQANVDLHSLRRWFIAKARDAINAGAQGFTMYTVAEVVGHQKGDLGLSMTSRYAGRETMEARAACVRAVKLPSAVTS
jgi:integrase